MQITIVNEATETIMKIKGRLDTNTAHDFQCQALEQLHADGKQLRLDCAELEYVSSFGLRSLLILAKQARAYNAVVVLCNLQDVVQDVLKISGFDSFFEVRHKGDA